MGVPAGGVAVSPAKIDAATAQQHAGKPVFAVPSSDHTSADVYFPESFHAALSGLGLPTEKLHGRVRVTAPLMECW